MAYNIQKRGTVYYFRRRIPQDLIEKHAGKREIIRSLGTKDRAEAQRLARKVSAELDDEWQAMRTAPSATSNRATASCPVEVASDADRAVCYFKSRNGLLPG